MKILVDKKFISQTNDKRPFQYKPLRSFDDVSGNLLTDMIKKVFGGSREQMLVRLMDQKKLNKRERQLLKDILEEKE